jgi:Glyoxalase-like domain
MYKLRHSDVVSGRVNEREEQIRMTDVQLSVNPEQLPPPGKIYLDHVGWMVPDMEAAAVAFDKLGLPLTPLSIHGVTDPATGVRNPTGTANRLAMLQQGYLEILTPHGGIDNPTVQHLQNSIARHIGVHLLAFTVPDAEESAKRLAAEGFKLQPTVHLRRTIEAEDGTQAEVAFTVIRTGYDAFPEARCQMLTHHTPDHMWQKRYLPSESCITGLVEASLVVDDPAECAVRFSKFLGRTVMADKEDRLILLDRGRLRFVKRHNASNLFGAKLLPPNPSVGSITLMSSDIERTRDVFLSNGLHPGSLGSPHLLIDAAEGLGVHIVVVPAG